MKILLYDVDSIIPNIAIMKLSSYHKKIGDEVFFLRGNGVPLKIDFSEFEYGYASLIFTKNKKLVENFPFEIGGTGYDVSINLSHEIEHMMPDYSLYPENIYSIGFATRGCVRKCGFCFVPKKEGEIKFNSDISEFFNPSLKKIMLLDNNILAYQNYKIVFEQIRKVNKPTSFKQGMDFRLLNEDKVKELRSIKYDGNYIFAYDDMLYRETIERQMRKFREFFNPWSMKFFVLVGFNSSIEDDIFRAQWLVSQKCNPYIMRYESCYKSDLSGFYADMAAYYNQPSFFKKMTFKEFVFKRHSTIKRANFSFDIWKENGGL